jgi:hypothetical protein
MRAVLGSRLRSGSWPEAARIPAALARSYEVPSFGRSAGANMPYWGISRDPGLSVALAPLAAYLPI